MTTPAPAPAAPVAPVNVPGKTLGIISILLVVPLGLSVVGIILGFVARSQSKAAGYKNTPATVAIVLGFIALVITILIFVIAGITGGISASYNVG
jgi:hypothetical protein